LTPIPLAELASIVGGELHGDGLITGFATDNREVKPGYLFLAIKGAKVDGHDFAGAAMANGAVGALVERPIEGPYVLVPNLVEALARFGRHFRDRFDGPVVGITGSAGKTTTKEFLASALSALGPVLKTVGNRNTEYTAPLLWAELAGETQAVVVEMAMRGFGQIAHLASFSRPTVGVITNIGYSHMEMVESREGIARAKAELIDALPSDGTVVLPQDDDFFGALREAAGERPVVTFGFAPASVCRVIDAVPEATGRSIVKGFFDNIPWQAEIPVLGRHLAANAAAAVATAVSLGLSPQEAADGLATAELPPLRMQLIDRDGVKVLLDAYNAAPPSMMAALETLAKLPSNGQRLAILGQMNELGDATAEAHRQVGRLVARMGLARVALVGPLAVHYREGALAAGMDSGRISMTDDPDQLKEFLAGSKPGDVVLIKGSRSLALEKVLE